MITTIAGGVGAARLLAGLVKVVPPQDLEAIVNVGDDLVLHGLSISPDLDTVTYTLAGAINPETGWGLVDESWQARSMLDMYGGVSWFGLGDRDLGTHLYRTQRLAEGADLVTVTREIAVAWNLELSILPASCDLLRTMVTLAEDDPEGTDTPPLPAGTEISFQEYFVQRQHGVPVSAVRIAGVADARPSPGVIESIRDSEFIIVAPSNPIVSIEPVLAIPGVREAVSARRSKVIAVSPIVAGAALKGPADRMLTELGHEASVVGVARLYREFSGTFVIDVADEAHAPEIEALGMRCVVTPTVMKTPALAADLGRSILEAMRGRS